MNYTETLDKALSCLRQLDLDKALLLFYQLLDENPRDLELIDRIYKLEVKRPHMPGFERICRHIFSVNSSSQEFHEYFVRAYTDFSEQFGRNSEFSDEQAYNLLYQLSSTRFEQDCEALVTRIKKHQANNPKTPSALFRYCESLISKGQMLKAKNEFRYLITYYTETPEAQNAIARLSWVESQIVR
ncbi:hypothetical protein FLL45_11305 [Aliikangiella marina]|uniref:Tetratricopeptide repeat protein n=1 Tax=Aliikangiella marina TaxID=1712262 RepID=A0A545TE48_9GAMM|nr:hypothetical protein [Aliikangiella marina]TQV75495.1 hypothetical protein FLL45_11305 [Aliikangiella marina]